MASSLEFRDDIVSYEPQYDFVVDTPAILTIEVGEPPHSNGETDNTPIVTTNKQQLLRVDELDDLLHKYDKLLNNMEILPIETISIMKFLPIELKHYLLTFDRRFVIRDKKIIVIDTIPFIEERFEILYTIPMKRHYPNTSCVWLELSLRRDYYITCDNNEVIVELISYDEDRNQTISWNRYVL